MRGLVGPPPRCPAVKPTSRLRHWWLNVKLFGTFVPNEELRCRMYQGHADYSKDCPGQVKHWNLLNERW